MTVQLVREVPGQNPETIISFQDSGDVKINSRMLKRGMEKFGIPIPEVLQDEYGGQRNVKLYTEGTTNINPFFKKAFENLYAPDKIIGKGLGEVKWITK